MSGALKKVARSEYSHISGYTAANQRHDSGEAVKPWPWEQVEDDVDTSTRTRKMYISLIHEVADYKDVTKRIRNEHWLFETMSSTLDIFARHECHNASPARHRTPKTQSPFRHRSSQSTIQPSLPIL